ncbi:B12-binding domain-containing radical SAM protein [Patescibacteria group bacterium]|nr:B12-binding domain-containing radical SAM protein [Patescibacteria group bacterium]
MKIFILNPNFNIERRSVMNVRARQPLSLATIAAILQDKGHEIRFLDANVLNYTVQKTIDSINEFESEVLILTTTPIDRWECPNSHINNIFKILDATKAKHKIITGSHGTVDPDWIFNKSKADIVVKGEPEKIVEETVDNLSAKGQLVDVKGISFKQDKKIIHNSQAGRINDLDALPLPAYELLPMEKYHASGFKDPFSIMMTSRGCPYSCTFCLKAMSEGNYISQSPERVLIEIEYLIINFGIKSIYFQDWEYLVDIPRVEKISDLLINNEIKISWGCNARATDIVRNQDIIEKIKKAGCFKINIGLESASDQILENINKKTTQKDLKQAIYILRENKIDVGYYVLINCPGEDKETIQETVNFILDHDLKVKNFNPAIPYPGTKLYQKLKELNPDKKFSWENIEKYAGRIGVRYSPKRALMVLRHYKYKKKYGKAYFLNPKFLIHLVKKK